MRKEASPLNIWVASSYSNPVKTMSNIQIESDKEILNKIDGKLDNLQKDVTELKVGQTEVKGDIKRLDSNISTLKEDIKEIKGSQKAQVWTLIGVLNCCG